MDIQTLKHNLRETVDSLMDELMELSQGLHDNPETALEETRSSQAIAELLERHDFDVERGIGDLPTAFRGTGKSDEGSTFAFIAEYDALPELGHACGHNLIAAASAGAAIATARILKAASIPGSVVLMGTPAEERGGGKVILVDRGCFDDIDFALMVHPSSQSRVDDISLASTRLVLTYRGVGAHAAAAPWEGANALEAVIQTFNLINAWRCQLRSHARINGIITKGGTAVNIIPDLAEASFGIRAGNRPYLEELVEKVKSCASAASAAMGVEVSVERMGRGYDAISNNPVITELMAANYGSLGEALVPLDPNAGLGSTDMGNVTQKLPSAHCYVKVKEGITPHTVEFAEACVGENARRAIAVAAKAMAMTALDLLLDPELQARAKERFLAAQADRANA